MSFEGGNPSPRQERQSLSAEWLKFNIDPTLPLTVRTWIRDLTEEKEQDLSLWPASIQKAVSEYLHISVADVPSHEIRATLTDALAQHDERYRKTKSAAAEEVPAPVALPQTPESSADIHQTETEEERPEIDPDAQTDMEQFVDNLEAFQKLKDEPAPIVSPRNSAEKQGVAVQEFSGEVSSEPDTEESMIAEMREALADDKLSSKDRKRIQSALARVDAPAAAEQPEIAAEMPETGSEIETNDVFSDEALPLEELRSHLEEFRLALSSRSLDRKRRAQIEAAVPRYEARIAHLEKSAEGVTEVLVETEAPQVAEVANTLPEAEKVVADKEAQIDRLEEEPERIAPESASKPVRGEISPEAAQLFEKTFNIKNEELASIEGFNYLSAQQQKFVLENLSQLTLGNVREEAARTVSEAVGMRKSEMTQNYGKFIGGVLAGAREAFTGGYTKLKTEKAVVERMEKGGMAEHGALLQELVSNIAKYGPRVNERAGGELVVDLVNIRDRASDQKVREAEFFAIGELNAAAYEFTKTPAEWKGKSLGTEEWKITSFFKEKVLRTSGKVQESAYEKRAAAYEQKKRQLEEVLKQKGYDDLKIAETLIGLDSRVHQLQTLRTSPDAMAELANIKDKSFFAESAKQFFRGPGAYMALGAVGRTLGGAALGFFGAPVASATIASFRSWNRSAAELRERDRNARAGVVDTKKGALNVVSAERAEQTVLVNGKEMQNGLTAKLVRLAERAQSAHGDEKKRLLAQLRTRVEYVHDKQKLQRVDYGKVEGRVSRQVALTEALAQSLTYLATEDLARSAETTARSEKTNKRLDQKLSRVERTIIELRLQGRESDLVKSAATAASFAVAGALIADYFRKDSVFFGDETESVEAADVATKGDATILKERPEVAPDGGSEYSDPTFNTEQNGAEAAVENIPGKEVLAPYTIQRGDTLIELMREKIPAIHSMGEEPTMARENATMNILRDLTRKELQDIGITSGDVNKIYAGDSINMEKLNEAILARKGMIERAIERFGATPIGAGAPDSIPTAASAEVAPLDLPAIETPVFKGGFDGELMTEDTVAETFPIADVVGADKVELVTEAVKTEAVPLVAEASVTSEVIAERKTAFMNVIKEGYASDRDWKRMLNLRMQDIARYEGVVTTNPESVAGRAQTVFAMKAALEAAGFDATESKTIFERFVNGKLSVGAYLEAVSQAVAIEGKPEVYEKFLKAIDSETVGATAMEQWTKPEAVAARSKELQTLFTESLRANDRTAWARWAQGWQSPFSNKSELFLESTRQHLISQREQFVDLLKEYRIPLAPQAGESQPESIARFSRLLAEKITPEDLQKLNV